MGGLGFHDVAVHAVRACCVVFPSLSQGFMLHHLPAFITSLFCTELKQIHLPPPPPPFLLPIGFQYQGATCSKLEGTRLLQSVLA